jgi:hypothetical protein
MAPWENDFLIWSLDHANSMGYIDAEQPRNWLMKFLIGRFTNGPDYDPMDGAPYQMAVMDKSGNPYSTWKELWDKTFYCGGGHKTTSQIQGNTYYNYARAVLTIAVRDNLPKASEAYNFLATQLGDTYKSTLKWAFKSPSEVTPLTIATSSLPSGMVGSSYSQTLTASGGTAPYTWSILSGSLPTGLNINASSGTISGTPTIDGTWNFTAQVIDVASDTATKDLPPLNLLFY